MFKRIFYSKPFIIGVIYVLVTGILFYIVSLTNIQTGVLSTLLVLFLSIDNSFGGTCGNGNMFSGSISRSSSGMTYMANTASQGSHFSYNSKDEAIRLACGE